MPFERFLRGSDIRLLLWAGIPMLYWLACLLLMLRASLSRTRGTKEWAFAKLIAASSFAFACCSALALILDGPAVSHGPGLLRVRIDSIGAIMLFLVTFLGWVIVRYSENYLAGDPMQARYLRALMATLAAVGCLVITNSLATFWMAWVATSLCLHLLLTIYPERQPAIIVARKKFLASRIAESCLLAAIVLVRHQTGTFQIDQVLRYVEALGAIPGGLKAAAVLIAVSAIVKCAQLPLHGWLIQVMEAPTPVSALLHAGIVNLGGFMLIRLAPLGIAVAGAQVLLVIVGCTTAVLASLVMMTRVSIKVNLAWSTCAQMGFMLMQCGLGLYDLALLHLLAHSLYKAHAFLGSGSTVDAARLRQMAPSETAPSVLSVLLMAVMGLLFAAAAAYLWGVPLAENSGLALFSGIVGFAILPILLSTVDADGPASKATLLLTAGFIPWLYFGLHRLFAHLVPWTAPQVHTSSVSWIFVAVIFATLNGFQAWLRLRPDSKILQALYPWFYAGFYLDECFTRVTFRLWPGKVLNMSNSRRDAARYLGSSGAMG